MKHLVILLLLLQGAVLAQGQRLPVKSTISTASGEPLAGVNVIIKTTSRGTTTDAEGKFSIDAEPNEVLVISFIGFTTLELRASEVPPSIRLSDDVTTLGEIEIVSTGYQAHPLNRTTGSFVHIDNSLFNRRVSTDILSRIEDVTPGLIFQRNIAGKQNDISIRGQSTLFASTSPLIVVDNFPYDGNLASINPNDVESVTVLKDAAAASIWGARAGNGVIVITTKKGKADQAPLLAFNSNVTIGEKPDLFYPSRMSSADFIAVESELFSRGVYNGALLHASTPVTPAVTLMAAHRDGRLSDEELSTQLGALAAHDVRDDYEKYLYRPSVAQQYAMNLSGGNASNRYFISAGWDSNSENLVGNSLDRVTLNANNSWVGLSSKLEFSLGLYYSKTASSVNNPGPAAIRFNASRSSLYPYASLADDQGNPADIYVDYKPSFLSQASQKGLLDWTYSPLEEIENADNKNRVDENRINTRLAYKITPWLNAEVLYQYFNSGNFFRNHQSLKTYYTRNLVNSFTSVDAAGQITRPVPSGGILDESRTESVSHNLRTQLNLYKVYNSHSVTALAGFERRRLDAATSSVRYYGYDDALATTQPVDYTRFYTSYVDPAFAFQVPNSDGQRGATDRFLSWYANAAWTFREKYSLYASARKDMSNLFGVSSNQRGVPLWSLGASWNVSEEDFYRFSAIPYFKLRVSIGENGNVDRSVTAFTTASRFGSNPLTGLPYAVISNPPNPELQWERVRIVNAGVDLASRNNRVRATLEMYRKSGMDLMGRINPAPSTGVNSFRKNYADTRVTGVDLALNTLNVDRAIRWETAWIFSHLKEKVVSYDITESARQYINNGSGSAGVAYPLEGKPLYALYSYAWAGLDPETGDPRSYLDGQPSTNYGAIIANATPENITFHGSARPTTFGAFRNTISWKNLSLSANVSYRLGYFIRRNSVRYSNLLAGSVEHGDYSRRWLQPGDEIFTNVPSMPLLSNNNREEVYLYSSHLVERGDHIRLQDVNLSWSLTRNTFAKLPVRELALYTYANNLGIIWSATKESIDPDFQQMKPTRSLAFGLKATF